MTGRSFSAMIDSVSDIWRAPDGWPIRRARFDPQGEDAGRGSMLFLSGRGDHMEKYAESLHHWAVKGWTVESFDWRGQGGSGRLADDPLLGHVEDFGCWLDDLEAYCAQWRRRSPPPHVIVAHSMGGHMVLRALAEGRVRAAAAVLVAPMLGIGAGGLPQALGGGIAGVACALGYSGRSLWASHRRTQGLMDRMQTTLTHCTRRYEMEAKLRRERPDLVIDAPSWGWIRAAYRSMAALAAPGVAERVTAPLLILATRGDRLVSAPAIERMARRLSTARVHFYDRDVAHEILREVDDVRDDALARIDTFFADHAPARKGVEATA